jgi:hypothetical protein
MSARCGKATAALQERKAHSSTWSSNYSHLPNRTAHNGALRGSVWHSAAMRCTLAPMCPTESRNNGLLVWAGILLARVLERAERREGFACAGVPVYYCPDDYRHSKPAPSHKTAGQP